jgi:hypothetical protein
MVTLLITSKIEIVMTLKPRLDQNARTGNPDGRPISNHSYFSLNGLIRQAPNGPNLGVRNTEHQRPEFDLAHTEQSGAVMNGSNEA